MPVHREASRPCGGVLRAVGLSLACAVFSVLLLGVAAGFLFGCAVQSTKRAVAMLLHALTQ